MLIKNPSYLEFFQEYYIHVFGKNLGVLLILTISFIYFLVMLFMIGVLIFNDKRLTFLIKKEKNLINQRKYNDFQIDKNKTIKILNQTAPFPCLSLAFLVCMSFSFVLSKADERAINPQNLEENLEISKNENCNDAIEYLYQSFVSNQYISNYSFHHYLNKNHLCFENKMNKVVVSQKPLSLEAQKWLNKTIEDLKNPKPEKEFSNPAPQPDPSILQAPPG